MKTSEILKTEQALIEFELDGVCDKLYGGEPLPEQERAELKKRWSDLHREVEAYDLRIRTEVNRELDVGDGCTIKYWTDRHACTVIRKTAKTITIQRDKAVLADGYKPEWVIGGFSAICLNNSEQKYTYERDPEGETWVCRWSEKHGCYRAQGSLRIYPGRHEFYDYNF